jgi:short-subunit dehydrogenase
MSSVAGKIARPLSSIYDATKHALEAVSDGLRGELKRFGIRVLVIEPGFVQTEFTDIAKSISLQHYASYPEYQTLLDAHIARDERWRQFAATADDVADTIVWAVQSNDSKLRHVMPGFARLVLMLKRVLPERLFHRLIDV